MEYNIENHLIFMNAGSKKIFGFCLNWNQVRGGDEVLKVMSCELEDLRMSSTAKLSSCCVLVATCPELVFSCSIVIRRVLEAVLDHNNVLVVPSITKCVVLVRFPTNLMRHVFIVMFMSGKTTLLGSPRLKRW